MENDEHLQPQKHQVDDALDKSRGYWYPLASLAYTYRDHGLDPEYTNPQSALHRTPKFEGRPKIAYDRPFGVALNQLCLQASSTWKLVGNSNCDKIGKERTNTTILQIGTSTAIPYSFNGNVFSSWIGTTEEKTTVTNYLGVLTIGWCYILSARLVEIQGETAVMQYTNSEADWYYDIRCHPHETHIVDIGEADDSVARWWAAILAKREGWKAIVRQTPAGEFLAPWAASRVCERSFAIKRRRRGSSNSGYTPLSSDRAFTALSEFACFHGLGSQVPIALASALTFPAHKYCGSTVRLPFPKEADGKQAAGDMDTTPKWSTLMNDLPYYMTVSCNPDVMMATLCGSFWEPEVPCNLVSPWLHPILDEVVDGASAITADDQEIIALVGAIRRPNVSALWIGAATSGLVPKVLQKVRRGIPPLDSLAFPWTGCPQSFMDMAGSGPYTCENPKYILRADVWHLLHLPSTEDDDLCYQNRPFTPWAPCGKSLVKDCALRVASHLKCPRHEYQYSHWTWLLEDGAVIQDCGFSKSSLSTMTENFPDAATGIKKLRKFEEKELDQRASLEASLEIFHWFIINGEGRPSENIYQDDWLAPIWYDESAEELDEDDDNRDSPELVGQSDDRFETWLSTIVWQDPDQSSTSFRMKKSHTI